jgi:hypothetical protein
MRRGFQLSNRTAISYEILAKFRPSEVLIVTFHRKNPVLLKISFAPEEMKSKDSVNVCPTASSTGLKVQVKTGFHEHPAMP